MAVSSLLWTPFPTLVGWDSDSQHLTVHCTLTMHVSGVGWEVLSLRESPCPLSFPSKWLKLCLPGVSLVSNFLFLLNACVLHCGCFLLLVPALEPGALLLSHHLPKRCRSSYGFGGG